MTDEQLAELALGVKQLKPPNIGGGIAIARPKKEPFFEVALLTHFLKQKNGFTLFTVIVRCLSSICWKTANSYEII